MVDSLKNFSEVSKEKVQLKKKTLKTEGSKMYSLEIEL